MKRDNSELVKKIFILEELLRDSEVAHRETKSRQGDRIKELESKLCLEKEKSEDSAARIEYLEEENASLVVKQTEIEKHVANLISENKELSAKISNLERENTDQKHQLDEEEGKCVYEVSHHHIS